MRIFKRLVGFARCKDWRARGVAIFACQNATVSQFRSSSLGPATLTSSAQPSACNVAACSLASCNLHLQPPTCSLQPCTLQLCSKLQPCALEPQCATCRLQPAACILQSGRRHWPEAWKLLWVWAAPAARKPFHRRGRSPPTYGMVSWPDTDQQEAPTLGTKYRRQNRWTSDVLSVPEKPCISYGGVDQFNPGWQAEVGDRIGRPWVPRKTS